LTHRCRAPTMEMVQACVRAFSPGTTCASANRAGRGYMGYMLVPPSLRRLPFPWQGSRIITPVPKAARVSLLATRAARSGGGPQAQSVATRLHRCACAEKSPSGRGWPRVGVERDCGALVVRRGSGGSSRFHTSSLLEPSRPAEIRQRRERRSNRQAGSCSEQLQCLAAAQLHRSTPLL